MKHARNVFVACAAAAALAGCAAPGYPPANASSGYPTQAVYYYGVVDRIEVVDKDAGGNVAGTVIGAVVGGLLGHQIGSGSGNTAATIAGAAAGGYAGNRIEGRARRNNEAFRVTVRLADGSTRTVTQENIQDLRTGDRVRVDNTGVHRS